MNLEIPDADVWYCLGDNQGRGVAAGKLNTYYAMSPNDAANNYYLYNVANVFYDAIDLENTTKDQEMQLFINTLIGAYEFSYGTPYVTVDKVTKINGDAEKLVEDKVERVFETGEEQCCSFCKTGSFRRTFRRADRGAKAYNNAGTGNCVGEYTGWIR